VSIQAALDGSDAHLSLRPRLLTAEPGAKIGTQETTDERMVYINVSFRQRCVAQLVSASV